MGCLRHQKWSLYGHVLPNATRYQNVVSGYKPGLAGFETTTSESGSPAVCTGFLNVPLKLLNRSLRRLFSSSEGFLPWGG